jgi:hypothetical protein
MLLRAAASGLVHLMRDRGAELSHRHAPFVGGSCSSRSSRTRRVISRAMVASAANFGEECDRPLRKGLYPQPNDLINSVFLSSGPRRAVPTRTWL